MYRITIVEVTKEDAVEEEYQKVADSGNKQDGKAVYAYVPKKTVKRIERAVLSQEVSTIDLAAVIKAVNNL